MSPRGFLRRGACALGLAGLARRAQAGKVAVLMYHGVVADEDPLAQGDWLQVRQREFRAQMAYLAEHCQVCSLDDILTGAPHGAGRLRVLITFDDGYANNLHLALPVLQEFRFPALIFLVTAYVDSNKLFWWDRLHLACGDTPPDAAQVKALKRRSPREIKAAVDAYLSAKGLTAPEIAPETYRVMSRKELILLHESGLVSFGSHTHGHEILDTLSDAEASATMEVAAEKLAQWGVASPHFAPPNGDFSTRHLDLMRAAGCQTCFTTRPGLWHAPADPYDIPRMGIGRGTDIDQFALQIADFRGWLGWRP